MQGITQLAGDAGYCSNPFTLASQASCLLTLSIEGSQLSLPVLTDGPKICKTINNTISLKTNFTPAEMLYGKSTEPTFLELENFLPPN